MLSRVLIIGEVNNSGVMQGDDLLSGTYTSGDFGILSKLNNSNRSYIFDNSVSDRYKSKSRRTRNSNSNLFNSPTVIPPTSMTKFIISYLPCVHLYKKHQIRI